MRKHILIAVVFLLSIGIQQTATAAGKGNKVVSVVGKKGTTAGMKKAQPTADKAKEKGRDACTVHYNNYTGYYIDIYQDGVFWGTMAPWGYFTVRDGEGYTRIYCETRGGTYSWSATGDCSTTYEYKLSLANAN